MVAVDGMTYQQAAESTGRSPSTVRTHLHKAYQRLNASSATDAARVMVQNGWVEGAWGTPAEMAMLARIEALLERLVEAIDQRNERQPLTGAQRAYLHAFMSWCRSREDEDDPRRQLALERLQFVLAEANLV